MPHDIMGKKVRFLTGSSYEGSWHAATRTMNVFGTYLYPDCSEYRGYFKNGKFHGYGRLRLATPHNFTVEGTFKNGVLDNITYMWFHDGLTINHSGLIDNKLAFFDWKYCTETDRRYVRELIYGLEPVQPNLISTADKKIRDLEKRNYDTVEGIFDDRTGFLTERIKPFKYWCFINCVSEREWICKNCRRSKKAVKEPLPTEQQKILGNDIRMAHQLQIAAEFKTKKTDPWKEYFYKLCEKERENGAECKISNPELIYLQTSELSQCPSFSSLSAKNDVDDLCKNIESKRVFTAPKVHEHVIVRRNTYESTHNTVTYVNSTKEV